MSYPIDQGHGIAGRYGGLPDEFSDLAQSKIVILPVAFDQTTTYLHGTDQGPSALIEASRHLELYDIETGSEVYLEGIATLPILKPKDTQKMLKEVYKQVLAYLKRDKFVVTIGGEHSISYPVIRAYAEKFPNLTVLQLDAHADLQETYEGDPWSHACVMARVIEIEEIDKIVSVGIRSISGLEKSNLMRTIPFFAHDLFNSDEWMNEVAGQLENPVYITIDLDVFDSSIMPSTGTPEPGGLNWHQVTQFLKKVIQQKNVVGFDIVELCPNSTNPAPDFLAAKLLYKLLSYKFKWGRHENP